MNHLLCYMKGGKNKEKKQGGIGKLEIRTSSLDERDNPGKLLIAVLIDEE